MPPYSNTPGSTAPGVLHFWHVLFQSQLFIYTPASPLSVLHECASPGVYIQ